MNEINQYQMDRKDFLKAIAFLPLASAAMKLNELKILTDPFPGTALMPVLFLGHGSPMNAIEDNAFTQSLKKLGASLPRPAAILVVSAHWLTKGTFVSVAPQPKMIYDMYGFPEELYKVKYPAPGAPGFAKDVKALVKSVSVQEDKEWGFDHGLWSVLIHLFPKADIPVFELSMDYHKPMQYHYDLAKELVQLRKKGVLVVGSGNITHNLRKFDMNNPSAKPVEWAHEFDEKIKKFLDSHDHKGIIDYRKLGTVAELSHPEPSHFLPLLYAIGLQDKSEALTYPHEGFTYGSFSMRCVKIG